MAKKGLEVGKKLEKRFPTSKIACDPSQHRKFDARRWNQRRAASTVERDASTVVPFQDIDIRVFDIQVFDIQEIEFGFLDVYPSNVTRLGVTLKAPVFLTPSCLAHLK